MQAERSKLLNSGREHSLKVEIERRDKVINGKENEIKLKEAEVDAKEEELLQWAQAYTKFEEESKEALRKALEDQYDQYKEKEADADLKIRQNEQLTEMADEASKQNLELEAEMIEIKSRMDQYERGTWGLYEAIQEIKKLKETNRRHEFVEDEVCCLHSNVVTIHKEDFAHLSLCSLCLSSSYSVLTATMWNE